MRACLVSELEVDHLLHHEDAHGHPYEAAEQYKVADPLREEEHDVVW
jgi:hypothetical protein